MGRIERAVARRIPPLRRILERQQQLIAERHDLTDERDRLAQLVRSKRDYLAHRYVKGNGVEIGALHRPLPLPPGTTVRYVDRLPEAELRRHYPELAREPLVPVDVIDDGETLRTIPDDSVDFVIANHFLEHCEDTIGALLTFGRVLRPEGTAFIAVPDMRQTFDRRRDETSLSHVIRDHELGPSVSRDDHFREWATLVENVDGTMTPDQVERKLQERRALNYSIHFHAWTPLGLLELVRYLLTTVRPDLDFVEGVVNGDEFIVILRKLGPQPAPTSP